MKHCNAPKNQTTRRVFTIVSAASLAMAFTSALPQPARAQPIAGEVMLVNVKTGKCLTIAGGLSTDNNVESVQFDCDSHPSRRWTLSRQAAATSTKSETCRRASV